MTSDSIHIHNRAIFDAVNDELQIYKPFYACGGVPFPWTLNAGLTSYQFTEESIQIVFFQVKEKIEEKLNHLCGMHLDFADDVESQDNEFYKAKMAFHERKAVTCEVAELDYTYEVEEEFARVLFNITDQIYLTLLIEAAADTGGYRLDRP